MKKALTIAAIPLAAALVYGFVALGPLRFVYLSDFFPMVWLAHAQRAGVDTAFACGFLGFGYPMLLNGVTTLVGDVLTAGKLIELSAGAAILLMVPATFRSLFGDVRGALVAQALLALDAVFSFAMAGETPDLLATALIFPSIALTARYVQCPSARLGIAAGAVIGFGYLVRYHVIALVPLTLLSMLTLARPRKTAFWVLAGFIAAAAPQLVVSAIVQGDPFYNLQAKALVLGYYGDTVDFVGKTKPYTLWILLTSDPSHIVKQYMIFLSRYFSELGGGLFLLAGLILAWRGESRPWLLLALPLIGLVVVLAVRFYTDRALLFPLVLWHVAFARAVTPAMRDREHSIARGIAILAVLAVATAATVKAGRQASRIHRYKVTNDQITAVLRAEGLTDARQVFTTHPSYYLGDDPTGGLFHLYDTWLLYDPNYAREFPHSYFVDIPSLTTFVRKNNIRFLLLGVFTRGISPVVFEAQQSGSLGGDYRLLRAWNDVFLYEYRPATDRDGAGVNTFDREH